MTRFQLEDEPHGMYFQGSNVLVLLARRSTVQELEFNCNWWKNWCLEVQRLPFSSLFTAFLIPLSLIIPVTPRSAGPAWRRKADRSLRYAVSVTGMRDMGGLGSVTGMGWEDKGLGHDNGWKQVMWSGSHRSPSPVPSLPPLSLTSVASREVGRDRRKEWPPDPTHSSLPSAFRFPNPSSPS